MIKIAKIKSSLRSTFLMTKSELFDEGIVFTLLTAVYVSALILANIASNKITYFFGFTIDAGYFLFPLTYIINDIVSEVYGMRHARCLIYSGLICNLFAIAMIKIVVMMKPAADFVLQNEFESVFALSSRIFLASTFSYLFGEFINSKTLISMKNSYLQSHKTESVQDSSKIEMGKRFIFSTICGSFVENSLFYSIAFIGAFPFHVVLKMMILQYIIKVGLEIAILPLTCFFARCLYKYISRLKSK